MRGVTKDDINHELVTYLSRERENSNDTQNSSWKSKGRVTVVVGLMITMKQITIQKKIIKARVGGGKHLEWWQVVVFLFLRYAKDE